MPKFAHIAGYIKRPAIYDLEKEKQFFLGYGKVPSPFFRVPVSYPLAETLPVYTEKSLSARSV
jgi:hypothetical protein